MGAVLRPDVIVESVENECEVRRILVDDIGFNPVSEKSRSWESVIAECTAFT